MNNFATAYSSDTRKRVAKDFKKPSLTKQSFKKECDINNILARFRKVAGKEFLESYRSYLEPKFGDNTHDLDYHSGLIQIREAEAVFGAMPSNLRARFDNDPGKLLSFLGDVNNFDEAKKLGFLKPDAVSPVQPKV